MRANVDIVSTRFFWKCGLWNPNLRRVNLIDRAYRVPHSAAAWVKKYRRGRKLHFFDKRCKFPIQKTRPTVAQNFNFVPNPPKIGGFSPKSRIFGRKFSDKKEIISTNNTVFGRSGQGQLLPCPIFRHHASNDESPRRDMCDIHLSLYPVYTIEQTSSRRRAISTCILNTSVLRLLDVCSIV